MTDSDKLALGLDDIIRSNKTTNRRGTKQGFRGRAGGRTNAFQNRAGGGLPRASNAPAGRWKHDLFENNTNGFRNGQRNNGVNTTTKLLISNLDYGVTTNDVQELFEDFGAVRVARVHYDETGRSLGTAEVVFERRVDAIAAQQKYNGVDLDGRSMDIRLVGNVDNGAQQQNNRTGGNQRSGFRQQNGTRGGANRTRGSGAGKQQQNGFKKETVTTEDLDADLEAYRAENATKK